MSTRWVNCAYHAVRWTRGVVTALKPVRAEQVRRPEWKQNWTVPHCGSILPICLSLRPVGSIHISCLAAREQTSAAQIAKASPLIIYFYSFSGIIFQFYFYFFLTEAAQYECSYRRTAHHATEMNWLMLSCERLKVQAFQSPKETGSVSRKWELIHNYLLMQ